MRADHVGGISVNSEAEADLVIGSGQAPVRYTGAVWREAEIAQVMRCDAPVGAEECVGAGPAVDDADDRAGASGGPGVPARGRSPSAAPWVGRRSRSPSKQSSWNQRTRSAAMAHSHHPVGVGLEAGEGEAAEPGVLQALDVLLDVGVGPHGGVEGDGVAVLVGVEAPVAEVEGREQAALGSGVQRLAPDDAAGALGKLAGRR